MAQNRRTPEPGSLVFSCDNSSWSSRNPGKKCCTHLLHLPPPYSRRFPGCWWQMGNNRDSSKFSSYRGYHSNRPQSLQELKAGKGSLSSSPFSMQSHVTRHTDGCGGHRYVLLLYGHRLFLNICLRWQGISMAFPFLWCIRKVTESREWWCIPVIPAVGKAEASGSQFEASLVYKVNPGQPWLHRETLS